MAHNWDQYTWRLVFRDNFTTYGTQADYEAAYPETLFGFPVGTYSSFGPTNGPAGEPGLLGSTDATYVRLGSGAWARDLAPERRVFKFIAHVDNDWFRTSSGIGATLMQPFSESDLGFHGLFQVENAYDHPIQEPGSYNDTLLISNVGNSGTSIYAENVFPHTPGSTKRVDVRMVYSTVTEIEPGVFEPNADGIVEGFVNDVLVMEHTGVVWNNRDDHQAEPYWNAIYYATLGRASLFEAWDTTDNVAAPPTVEPPEECPCPPPDGGAAPAPYPGTGSQPPSGTGEVGGGGFGNSGTSETGEEWTPGAIDGCTGGGTVLSYPEADPGESMAGNREPRIWIDVAFQSLNAENEGTATPAVWSLGPSMPDTTYGGHKQQRVLNMSRITRALSNDNGDWKGPSVTTRINDKDRQALRERLGDESTQFVWERLGIGYIASEANRLTGYGTPPRELFRGLTRDIGLTAGFTSEITFEDRLTSQIGAFSPDRTFSSRLLTEGLGCLVRELVGKPQQWILGEVSDEGATTSAGVPAVKGLVPIWLMAELGGEDEYHLCAHTICGMKLYGSDGGADGQPPKRIELTDWRFETVDRTDSETGLTHRMTMVYVPSDSIASQDHKSGRLNMAANVFGVAGANGLPLSDLFRQMQYVFEHIVLPEQESLTGEYVGSPQWPDGRYMIHSPSWLAAEELANARMGGYTGGFVLGGPAGGPWTMRDLLKRFSNSSGYWFGWTSGGQLAIKTLDDAALVDDSDVITEPAGMRALPSPYYDITRIENPFLFSYDWDDDKQKPRVAQESVRDDFAIARTGGREKPSRTPVVMRCVRDPATARDVAQRELLRRKYPAGYFPVVEPLDGLDRDPGDIIRITSIEGPGAAGVEELPLFIRETTFDPSAYRVTHDCRDVSAILAGAARAGDDSLPAYSLATTEQRRRYAFATDNNGNNNNGLARGKGAR